MRNHKRLLAMLLALCMVLSLIPAVSADEAVALASEDEVVIYYTNDVHTYIDKDLSYDNIAALKADTAEVAADVLLVDAGDHIQGTAYGSMDRGETIVELMEASAYDLATLGNHEFDYGMERALAVATEGAVPYVSCNFYHEENGVAGDTVLDAYQVFTLGDLTVAFVGVTTPETFTKSTPAYFQDDNGNYIYGIAGGEDGAKLYAAVQKAIDAASAEADIVIALAHLGDDPSSQPWTSEEVIANTTGLDAVIDGHSHSTVVGKTVKDKAGNDVLLTQTGEYFDAIGRMVIDAEGNISTGLLTVEGDDAAMSLTTVAEDGSEVTQAFDWTYRSDEDVAAIKNEWLTSVDEQLGEVIGSSEIVFDNYDADGVRMVRSRETNTGDFAADALYFLFDDMGQDVDLAIMNGGGVRNKAITGEISYKTCKDIHTFGNVACLMTVTGQQILDALEWGAKNVGKGENGGFLQVSGIAYTIDASIESTVQADDKGVWIGGPTGEYRVTEVYFWNEETQSYDIPLDVNAKYNLAGYNYTLRDLGDGFDMFDGAELVLDYVMEDYLVLANYVIKNWKEDPITAENSPYGSVYGEGRIYIQNVFEDVDANYWAADYIDVMYNTGLVKGVTSTTFEPKKELTRAEFATILYRMLDVELESYSVEFSDVGEKNWFYDEVMTLAELGVVEGYPDGTFAPNEKVTRQEMVKLIYEFTSMIVEGDLTVDKTKLDSFKDANEVGSWAVEAMSWAVENELINGYTDGTLAPQDGTKRAEASKVLVMWLLALANTEA